MTLENKDTKYTRIIFSKID